MEIVYLLPMFDHEIMWMSIFYALQNAHISSDIWQFDHFKIILSLQILTNLWYL